MHYIERDATGRIVRVAVAPFVGMTEEQQHTTPEIVEWLKSRMRVPPRYFSCSAATWKWFVCWKT